MIVPDGLVVVTVFDRFSPLEKSVAVSPGPPPGLAVIANILRRDVASYIPVRIDDGLFGLAFVSLPMTVE